MSDFISYQYASPSLLQRTADRDELFLAKYSEIEKKDLTGYFANFIEELHPAKEEILSLQAEMLQSTQLPDCRTSEPQD